MVKFKHLVTVGLSILAFIGFSVPAFAHANHYSLLDVYISENTLSLQAKIDPIILSEALNIEVTEEATNEQLFSVGEYVLENINISLAEGETLPITVQNVEFNYDDAPLILMVTMEAKTDAEITDEIKIEAGFLTREDSGHIIYLFIIEDTIYGFNIVEEEEWKNIADFYEGQTEATILRGNPPTLKTQTETDIEEAPPAEDSTATTVEENSTVEKEPERQITTQSFGESLVMGFRHILNGIDHLLFLAMLLIPAPLIVNKIGKKLSWGERRTAVEASKRILWIVTAFTVGHSITLAVVTLTDYKYPVLATELIVATSVGLAAVHALKPLISRGEIIIASVFGLIHGTAFAGKLQELNLQGTDLIVALLGFNIGVELAQIAVLAVFLPILWQLSKTNKYHIIRTILAIIGIVASLAWGTTLIIG